jgi:hypothetical protein
MTGEGALLAPRLPGQFHYQGLANTGPARPDTVEAASSSSERGFTAVDSDEGGHLGGKAVSVMVLLGCWKMQKLGTAKRGMSVVWANATGDPSAAVRSYRDTLRKNCPQLPCRIAPGLRTRLA